MRQNEEKKEKHDVDYGEPPGQETCATCEHYKPTGDGSGLCHLVGGDIDEDAWCELHESAGASEKANSGPSGWLSALSPKSGPPVSKRVSGWLGGMLGLSSKSNWTYEQGPRGGDRWVSGSGDVVYEEPAGWDGSKAPDRSESLEAIESLGATINGADQLDDEQLASTARGLAVASNIADIDALEDEAGGPFSLEDGLIRVTSSKSMQSPAVFKPQASQIVVAANDFEADSTESFSGDHVGGKADQLAAIISHEVGHAAHQASTDMTRDELKKIGAPDGANEISDRATMNAFEFVAESFNFMAMGRELPPDLHEAYVELGGELP